METTKPDIDAMPPRKTALRAALDFAHHITLQEFFFLMDEHRVTSVGPWIANGPGRGNPCVTLHFEDHEHAMGYLRTHYPDDTDEFRRSLIK